jgi:hypothetical protein
MKSRCYFKKPFSTSILRYHSVSELELMVVLSVRHVRFYRSIHFKNVTRNDYFLHRIYNFAKTISSIIRQAKTAMARRNLFSFVRCLKSLSRMIYDCRDLTTYRYSIILDKKFFLQDRTSFVFDWLIYYEKIKKKLSKERILLYLTGFFYSESYKRKKSKNYLLQYCLSLDKFTLG